MSEHWDELRETFDGATYSRFLDMRVIELGPGYSKIGMTVRPGWDGCWAAPHNGVVMSLADQAFGTATNTLNEHFHYVAVQFGISFLSEARVGEQLIAEGRVVTLVEGRGTTDMTVYGEGGRLVAKAHGTVLAIPKQ